MIYCHYEGVDGTATEQNHKKWIKVSSVQWGVGRAITLTPGATQNREGSTPSISEITFVKDMDGSTPKLFQLACGKDVKGKTFKFHFTRTGDPEPIYLEVTLTDALVSGYSVSSGGDTPSESVSLNFTKIELKYTPTGEDVTDASPILANYDATESKVG